MIRACHNGHVDIVILLLDRGALIDEKGYNHATALHHAAWQDDMDVCELLISRGADPMAVNKQNQTPLDQIGYWSDDNDPDHPTLPPPLTAAEKKERQDRLLEVFGE